MMLLNNDYYLDMKTFIMSQELSAVIKNEDAIKDELERHISDDTIHQTKQLTTTIKNEYKTDVYITEGGSTYNNDRLDKDTIKYLPIDKNVAYINSIIVNTPHNLNGFTLIFKFVVTTAYNNPNNEFVFNAKSESVCFNNFYNGTLIVMGDEQKKVGSVTSLYDFSRKTEQQVSDPIKFDNLNIKEVIANIESKLEKPVPIDNIIDYDFGLRQDENLNRIIIERRRS
jgi:hypothetical protein